MPGAIISVLAIQSLEKTIHEIKDYHQLHTLNDLMKREFNNYYNANGHVSIGLDYSILCISKKENKIYLSGSGSSIFTKLTTNELVAHKFDSINIGGKSPMIYEPNTISYNLNLIQSAFLFTDGVIDQKGFESGKKYGTKKLKELILNLNTKDSNTAINKIEKELQDWKGDLEQVDDMTLLGIQIHQA